MRYPNYAVIILKDITQLDAAAKKAAKADIRIRIIEFGKYEVRGDTGNWYTVICRKLEDGTRLVDCSCAERYPRRADQACYHMIPAVGSHILLAIAKRTVILSDL